MCTLQEVQKIPIDTFDVHGLQQKHSFVTSLFLDHTHAKNIEPVSLMIRINFINLSNPSPNQTVDFPFSLSFFSCMLVLRMLVLYRYNIL